MPVKILRVSRVLKSRMEEDENTSEETMQVEVALYVLN